MKKIIFILALACLPFFTFAQIAHIAVPNYNFCTGNAYSAGNTMTLTDATPGGKWYIISDTFYHYHGFNGAVIDSNTGLMVGVDTFSHFIHATPTIHVVYSVPGLGNDTVLIGAWYSTTYSTPLTYSDTICNGKIDTMTRIDAMWGKWSLSDSSKATIDTTIFSNTNARITGVSVGTVIITCGTANGCYSTGILTIVDCPTAILEVKQDTQPLIYPNPAINELTVNCSFERVIITNQVGQTVKASSNKNINISDLPSGIYFVVVKSLYDTKTEKLIKE